jgi:murein DD-endopeptidase MepM/ murein hydrolase activator NlpD
MRILNIIVVFFLTVSLAAAQPTRPASNAEQFAAKIAWQQQQEPARFGQFRGEFLRAWHNDDGLEALLSPNLEGRAKMIGFLGFLKNDHGALEALQFQYFDTRNQRQNPRQLAVYHTVFEDGSWWALRIGLDETGLIDRFIITDPNYNEVLPERTGTTQFELPFAAGEQWFVLWGGKSEEMNYHASSRSQRNALDLLIRHPFSGQSYNRSGSVNEDYYAYGRAVLAPVGGTVVNVIDGVEENSPGQMNPGQLTGNTVVIRVSPNEYLLLAHLKNGSIEVREGETVSVGETIGRVGNSGNSSEPHLHMQLMSKPSMSEAIGVEIRFRQLIVHGESLVANYSPVRSDVIERVSPAKPTDTGCRIAPNNDPPE